MKRTMSRIVVGVCLFTLMGVCATVALPLQELDLLNAGDALITYDQQSGLDWLDVAATAGFSWSDIENDVGGWMSLGFRHAHPMEVFGFMENAGFVSFGPGLSLDADDQTGSAYMALTSRTGTDYQSGMVDYCPLFPSDGHDIWLVQYGSDPNRPWYGYMTLSHLPDTASQSYVGHYLVRPHAVPDICKTCFLLVLSMSGIVAISRTRQAGVVAS